MEHRLLPILQPERSSSLKVIWFRLSTVDVAYVTRPCILVFRGAGAHHISGTYLVR